jgi:predicted ATPase/class 3 adenylate cyclase/tetratricopeptide (TPR) repeat protein
MIDLPTGTVTLLFTDIEGSTRLVERLGNRYVQVLAVHQKLLRAAFGQHHGHEVGTEGNGFFIAFAKASDAVAAAVAAQRALAAQPWPDGVMLRVRMGIHTGEPIVVARDYAGLDVHCAARICSAAHGGQALLSQPTCELLGHDLPAGVGLRDLGEHLLKDLTDPQRLFQLVIAGLPAEFPPLRTLGPRPDDLPTPLTRFIGRRRELAQARALLQREEVRLLALTGPGGTGKTRLALEIAGGLVQAFPDGLVFVGLAAVHDPRLVVPTIAQALGISEAPGQSLQETLAAQLRDRRLLLVLDNFEQVLPAAAMVVELLAACPRLKALVTSRAALHVSGEHTYPVPPLSLPDQASADTPDVASSDAVALFAERAQAVDPSFAVTDANAPLLIEICRRLDGLPLAIELAAARIRLLSSQALLSRLERRLGLLKGGARDLPARQQTLRATLDWSYELLEPEERTLFARLAVFAGGCSVEAAEAVCGLEDDLDVLAGLEALDDKNLLQPHDGPDGDRRVVLLETVREYGLERLAECGETDAVARRHAAYYLALAEQAEPELLGPEQGGWYERLEADLDNFRAVLDWALAHQQPEVIVRLAAPALAFLWVDRGHMSEGRRWLDAALEHRDSLSRPALAKALFVRSFLSLRSGGHDRQVDRQLGESLSLFQELEDTAWTVAALSMLGQAAERAGELDRAVRLHTQAVTLARDGASDWHQAMALGNLGLSLLKSNEPARAQAPLDESLTRFRAVGDPDGIAVVVSALAMLALGHGDHNRASSLLEQALTLARTTGAIRPTGYYLADLGIVALHQADYEHAATLFQEALRLAHQIEDKTMIAQCLWGMAAVAARSNGQAVRAVRLWATAVNLHSLAIPPFVVRPLEERLLTPLRDALGDDEFRTQWATGQALPLADAIADGLGRH